MTENDTIGDVGGAEKVTLTGAQSGTSAHGHGYTGALGWYYAGGHLATSKQFLATTSTTDASAEADASSAHDNMPPYLVIANYIIKT
jgi:microcystin-dependent protein